MAALQVVGREASIIVSDPWEFGSECGVGPFHARILDADAQRVLVTFDAPIHYSSRDYLSAICHVRHAAPSIEDLARGATIPVNIVLLPQAAIDFGRITKEEFLKGIAGVGSVELT